MLMQSQPYGLPWLQQQLELLAMHTDELRAHPGDPARAAAAIAAINGMHKEMATLDVGLEAEQLHRFYEFTKEAMALADPASAKPPAPSGKSLARVINVFSDEVAELNG